MTPEPTSAYAALSHDELSRLAPVLMLFGPLIDRTGVPWCTLELGMDAMSDIAIEEWLGASPIYTARMQKALNFQGTDVPTIFKGLQLDCGAPPQYMDFRFTVIDETHGEFALDHCGALVEVEPMGEELVTLMCHDMEDPTFDATAIATNPKARMRPIHRPPRVSTDGPHCRWSVFIDEDAEPLEIPDVTRAMSTTEVANLRLDDIDTTQPGDSDYTGELLSDIDFAAFSHSALVRIADEFCIQLQLLNTSFSRAVLSRMPEDKATDVLTNQAVGFSALAAERLVTELAIDPTLEGAARLLSLHPIMNPRAYVSLSTTSDSITIAPSPAHREESWLRLSGPGRTAVLEAVVKAVDPSFDVHIVGDAINWTAQVVVGEPWEREPQSITFGRMTTAPTHAFQPRTSIPIFPI